MAVGDRLAVSVEGEYVRTRDTNGVDGGEDALHQLRLRNDERSPGRREEVLELKGGIGRIGADHAATCSHDGEED